MHRRVKLIIRYYLPHGKAEDSHYTSGPKSDPHPSIRTEVERFFYSFILFLPILQGRRTSLAERGGLRTDDYMWILQ